MNYQVFASRVASFFAELRTISSSKGVEYANNDDQLANFKRLGARLGVSPEKVAMVLFTKHLDAIDHALAHPAAPTSEPVHGRILDAVLYLLLLDALISEGGATPGVADCSCTSTTDPACPRHGEAG